MKWNPKNRILKDNHPMQTCTEDQCVECGCTAHSYADDTQVYVSTPATDHSDATDRLTTCITRIRDLMASNRLKLNEEKTRIIWLGTCQQLDKVTVQALKLQNATVPFSSVVLTTLVFCSTVSLPWQIMLLHSADHASSTCDG